MRPKSAPFGPPSTPDETTAQLRNLHRGLKRVGQMNQLTENASLSEVRAKLNELIALITEVTRGGEVTRRY